VSPVRVNRLDAVDRGRRGGAGGGVVDVDVAVGAELRVDGDPEQPAMAELGVHRRVHRHPGGRRRQERPALDDPQRPGLLGDEPPAVRGGGEGARPGEAADDQLFGELRRDGGGGGLRAT
jgi:hypothetical protein